MQVPTVNIDGWHILGASVQGVGHAARAMPCQDAHLWRQLPGGGFILAVADGAGSAPRSADGARQAVMTAIETLAAELAGPPPAGEAGWTALLAEVYQEARDALCQLAAAAHAPLGDFATTLACAVAVEPWLVTAQLGDGWIVAQTDTGELLLTARPQRGEYANEAYFLTMDRALDGLDVQVYRERVSALAASTDGLLRLALRLPAGVPHAPFFRPLFDFAAAAGHDGRAQQELVRFLASAPVCSRTDDDKTLVLAARAMDRQIAQTTGLPVDGLLLLPAPQAVLVSEDITD
jgi:hypothetical protein